MGSMEYLVTAEEMQRYDANTIQHFKVPGIVLMEQAAMACLEEILPLCECVNDNISWNKNNIGIKKCRILILAGKGNNGADALALARLLHLKHQDVTICIVTSNGDLEHGFSEQGKQQYEIVKAMNLPVVTQLPLDSYDIIIDGIFGIGLNRDITGPIAEMIEIINTYEGYKVSLDIPSGIDGTTGKCFGVAFQADLTITFAFLKRGLYLLPGARYAGKVVKKTIGITEESFLGQIPKMYALTGNIKEFLPTRDPFGHKGTFGKVLLIVGSEDCGGAAILAAKAAFYSGCGMVKICTHISHKSDILQHLPEAMIDGYETISEAVEQVEKGLKWADVVAIGPGIGTDILAQSMLKKVFLESKQPLVIDADGLNLLADTEIYTILKHQQEIEAARRSLILTPHPLELARISHRNKEEISNNGIEIARKIAMDLNAVIVKKDANTIICDGTKQAMNLTGNHGMATAGSGDVLTGIMAAIMALKLPTFETALYSVYLHGLAGDAAAKDKNEYSMIATDIMNGIVNVLSEN